MRQDQSTFQKRRERLFEKMQPNSIAVLQTAPVLHRSADEDYLFCPDNNFYYFTGFPEPEAIAVLVKTAAKENQYILFSRSKDPVAEQWQGRRIGQEAACEEYGAQKAYSFEEFADYLPRLMVNKEVLYFTWGQYQELDYVVKAALNRVRHQVRAGVQIPDNLISLDRIAAEMRLKKDEVEIELLKKASAITVAAHKRALLACKPGKYEYQIHAELVYEFMNNGCQREAYESIVAGGANACILHYVDNKQLLQEGDLLLVDAGGKYNNYCADLTRTYPVSGRFSAEQKAIYEVVLKAQQAALEMAKPGNAWIKMEQAAAHVITEGLVDLGILQGKVDELVAKKAYQSYYMHKIGHWLGMDVHDVGCYKEHGEWRQLEPDMVTTVEPGIYIKPGSAGVDERWHGIGVRIEDDVLITESGPDIMTSGMPKTVAEIEALMAEKQFA